MNILFDLKMQINSLKRRWKLKENTMKRQEEWQTDLKKMDGLREILH